jgi:hypothetical protein
MLKQEELAFMKAISTLQLSPALLRELRSAMAASKRRKALAPGKAKPSGEVVDEVQSSHKPLQLPAGKRKATELSTSDGVSEPAARRPAPSSLAVEASAAVCAAGEMTAGTSRQPHPMDGWAGVCRGGGRTRRPTSGKWASQAHSQTIGYSQTCCLI